MLQPITKFREEIFTGGPKTMKFMKVLSLQSFRYTVVGYSNMDLGLHSHLPIFASSCVITNCSFSEAAALTNEHSGTGGPLILGGRGLPGNFTPLGGRGPNLTFLRRIYT